MKKNIKLYLLMRAAVTLLLALFTAQTAGATVRMVTFTLTDNTHTAEAIKATFTATGDINATYTVNLPRPSTATEASWTLGDFRFHWVSSASDSKFGVTGSNTIHATLLYPNWTFTISNNLYIIDNVKYYSSDGSVVQQELDNDTKSIALTTNNFGMGGTYGSGIHSITIVYSDPPAYRIGYELNGGTNDAANPEWYESATGVASLANPTRTFKGYGGLVSTSAYDFGGWYDNAGLSGSPVTSIPANSTGAKTLYAKWTAHTYTITYYPNEGTMPSSYRTTYTVETPTFNLPTPSRDGYYFRGWYTNDDFAGANYTQIKERRYARDFTFYAKWEKWNENGDGTKWNPYKVKNEADLRALATKVSGGDECDGVYYQQTADITITGGNWTPIGTENIDFSGNYDGGGYTISGITIDTSDNFQGLFGNVTGTSDQHCGFIQNIILENSSIHGGDYTGGIVGWLSNGHALNCHVRSSVTVTGTSDVGGIVGYFHNGTVSSCTSMATVSTGLYVGGIIGYMTQKSGRTATATDCFSYGNKPIGKLGSGTKTNVRTVYRMRCTDGSVTLPDAVAETDGFYWDGIGYYKPGVAIPLTVTPPAVGYDTEVTYTGNNTITPDENGEYFYTVIGVSGDETFTAKTHVSSLLGWTSSYAPDGTTNPYVISSAEGWNLFCDCLAEENNTTWNRFSGKTVALGADITVSRMAGSQFHDFCGTFDGQGHTLTFNYITGTEYAAPFHYVSNEGSTAANFRNLHVAGDIYTSAKYAAGLIAQHWGTVNVKNCRSSIVIHSSVSGDGTHGGFEAESKGGLNITGCVFDGKLLTTGTTATTNCGGFVGFGTLNISNSLYAPAALDEGEAEITSGSATFVRNSSAGSNCYYTRTLGTAQGKQARSITAGENVTVANAATATEYATSGITAYTTGIQYNNVLYAGSGDAVSLTLSHVDREGCTFDSYTATNGGSLNGSTLTMPDANVVITANYTLIPVSYINANCDEQTCTGYTVLTGLETELAEGWYVADGNVSFDHQLTASGDVHIILKDNAVMSIGTAQSPVSDFGIYGNGHSISIYAQSTGDSKGKLQINASGVGIFAQGGNVGICGGEVTATAGSGGNGIFAVKSGDNGGCITLTNATVTASGDIGICANGGIIINSGTVTANGLDAIQASGCDLTINGGKVMATATNGNGIHANGGNVEINGGEVEATGSAGGFGIYATKSGGNGGCITLGWTDASDYIHANGYFANGGTLSIASGKDFIDDDGTLHTSTNVGNLNGKTLRPYNSPRSLTVANITKTSATLSWTAGGEETQWRVSLSADNGSTWSQPVTVDENQYVLELTGLSAGTAVRVKVESVLGEGVYSAPATITFGTPIDYLDISGTTQTCTDYTVLTGSETTLAAGWYVADGEVSFNQLTASGDVHIILKDGAVMSIGTAQSPASVDGIYGNGHSISIYAQSTGDSKGKLLINASEHGIYAPGGNVEINGGEVEATGSANCDGIYATKSGGNGGCITLTNATVTASGLQCIYAQGGLIINSGTVTANGSYGIFASGCDLTINGGKVMATATNGYGIYAYGGNAEINGGEVDATGSLDGYGIYAFKKDGNGGCITLGWTDSSDYIYANGYFANGGTLSIASGKDFIDDDGNTYSGTMAKVEDAYPINGMTLKPYTTETIEMNSSGIRTYASEYDLDFTAVSGLTAYVASSISGNTLTLTPVGKVPGGTGLLLKGTASTTFTVPTTGSATTIDGNLMVGLTEATLVSKSNTDGYAFILANGKFGINWYLLDEVSYTLMANSAYLRLSGDVAPNESRALTMVFEDGTTGVCNPTPAWENAAEWYDLQGRRLNGKPTKHGVYVNGGRKVVIK